MAYTLYLAWILIGQLAVVSRQKGCIWTQRLYLETEQIKFCSEIKLLTSQEDLNQDVPTELKKEEQAIKSDP